MGENAVSFGTTMRMSLLAGVAAVANPVRATMGPKGRYVALPEKAHLRDADYSDRSRPESPVLVTNDGVTVARSIVLKDPLEEIGARLVRDAAIKVGDEAGDGTTTAVVLTQALLEGCQPLIASGADPLALHRGMTCAAERLREALHEMAHPITTQEQLFSVAFASCRDEQVSDIVAKAIYHVGLEGVVVVRDSQRQDTSLDLAEGITFDRGLGSPHLATDAAHGTAELKDPYILLTDYKITNPQDLIPTLMCAAEDGRDCLIVSDGVEGDALGLMVENQRQGDMHTAYVIAPEYGEGRSWRMSDLAVQTGGVFIEKDGGISLHDVDRSMLGSARLVRVDRKRTTIMDGGGDPQAIKDRIAQLRYYTEHTGYEFNRKRHAERLAKFVSGVATINVGGTTDAEQRQRRMIVDDAVSAARSAFRGGVVAGGGTALLDAAISSKGELDGMDDDELSGARVALSACEAPMRQIARNAGVDPSGVIARVAARASGTGYDAASGTYVDMVSRGIVDPLPVTLAALDAACSVASTVLLAEVAVTEDGMADASILQLLGRSK